MKGPVLKSNVSAGILFAAEAAIEFPQLLGSVRSFGYSLELGGPMFAALSLYMAAVGVAALILLSLLSFQGRRDALMPLCFAGMTACSLVGMFTCFRLNMFSVAVFGNGWEEYKFSVLCLLPFLTNFAAFLSMAALTAADMTGSINAFRALSCKLWFLPCVIYAAQLPLAGLAALYCRNAGGFWPAGDSFFRAGAVAQTLLIAAGLLCLGLWAARTDGAREERIQNDGSA